MTSQGSEPQDLVASGEQSLSHVVRGAVQFLRIARYRRSVFAVTLVVASLLGLLYYATATRYYQADASLLILQVDNDASAPTVGSDGGKTDIMPTYQQLIKSAIVLQDAINILRPEYRVDFEHVPRDKWVDTLESNLVVNSVRRTNILELHYRSRDPIVAVEVVKAVREAYFNFVERTYRHTAAEIIDILSHERTELEAAITAKEIELINFRQQHGDLGIQANSPVLHPLVQRAVTLNDALVQAMEKRLELQSSLAAIQAAVRNGEGLQQHMMAIEGVVGRDMMLSGLGLNDQDSLVQSNLERELLSDRAKLDSVKEYFGPVHPKYAEIAQRIVATEKYLGEFREQNAKRLSQMQDNQLGPLLVQMLQQSVARAWQQEANLRESFEAARQEAVARNGDFVWIETLQHDLERMQGMHDALVAKIANTVLQQQHGEIRVEIVKEPEIPTSAATPRLSLVVIVCLLGALVAGAVIVCVQDALDDRFRSPEELRARLGVQTLAMIRTLPPPEIEGLPGLLSFVAPDSLEGEAFRTLRTALSFCGEETTKLVISSSEPGDGKTTVLANLAVSIAQSGKKTILIDADLRRPGMTNLLALKGVVGLSDILHSDENVAEMATRCVTTTQLAGLDVLPSGPRRPNPAELLTSPRLADLLAWAESRYDQILIDSPPVLAASDVLIIGKLVDGAILVVQPEKNKRRLVIRSVENFSSVGVPLLGAVANRVGENGATDYAYDYGYNYAYHYSAAEDDDLWTDKDQADGHGVAEDETEADYDEHYRDSQYDESADGELEDEYLDDDSLDEDDPLSETVIVASTEELDQEYYDEEDTDEYEEGVFEDSESDNPDDDGPQQNALDLDEQTYDESQAEAPEPERSFHFTPRRAAGHPRSQDMGRRAA